MAADNCKSKTKEIKSDCVEDSMLEANKVVGTYSNIQQLLPNRNKILNNQSFVRLIS